MAEKFRYVCQEPTTLLFSSITQKSAPRTVANATPKFSGQFGVTKVDMDAIIPLMVQAITAETGGFTGNPNDYYLACMTSRMAIERVKAKAELDCMGKSADDAFKIREKAEKRCAIYQNYAGILSASSQFDIELARLEGGKIVDIPDTEHARAQAGKDLFYPGAIVVPSVAFQGFRRKSLDAKDGTTAFLQNVLFLRKGPRIDTGGGASNSDVFGGFTNYSDFDPTAMAPGGGASSDAFANFASGGHDTPPSEANGASAPPPPPPPAGDPNRPQDPKFRHDNGNGTEQWYVGTAWDGGAHPIPAAAPPPPPAASNPPPPPGAAGNAAPMW